MDDARTNAAGDAGHAATLDAWRERGAHRFDPVRFRFIEALARRSAAHGGEARRILDERLAGLLAAYAADVERGGAPLPESGRPDASSHRTALAELVDHLARASAEGDGRAKAEVAAAGGHPPELKTLRDFRSTWSKLSADQRLAQSMAKVPGHAGPLNSHHLVQRSLTLMRELSPEYVHRFMAHVDALLWLEGWNSPPGNDRLRSDQCVSGPGRLTSRPRPAGRRS